MANLLPLGSDASQRRDFALFNCIVALYLMLYRVSLTVSNTSFTRFCVQNYKFFRDLQNPDLPFSNIYMKFNYFPLKFYCENVILPL